MRLKEGDSHASNEAVQMQSIDRVVAASLCLNAQKCGAPTSGFTGGSATLTFPIEAFFGRSTGFIW